VEGADEGRDRGSSPDDPAGGQGGEGRVVGEARLERGVVVNSLDEGEQRGAGLVGGQRVLLGYGSQREATTATAPAGKSRTKP
jgi:hypothetical protein